MRWKSWRRRLSAPGCLEVHWFEGFSERVAGGRGLHPHTRLGMGRRQSMGFLLIRGPSVRKGWWARRPRYSFKDRRKLRMVRTWLWGDRGFRIEN